MPRLAATRIPDDVRLVAVPEASRRVWALTRPAARGRRAVGIVVDALVEAGRRISDDRSR